MERLIINSLKTEIDKTEILKEFIAVFNTVGAGRGIDTMEREEIWEAFCKLCELASVSEKDREKI